MDTEYRSLDALGLLREIEGVGRDARRGGYSRHVFDDAERTLRDWFVERARGLGLGVDTDRNGNIWAWWGEPGPGAVVTGSHLDSVPGGGAHDGPLGVVSALDAVARLKRSGFVPARPLAIVVFAEEEGSRFGIACLGSRLLSGAIDPDRAGTLVDASGRTFAEVASDAGLGSFGRDDEALARIGVFVELHVEQGRGLVDLDAPVAVGSSILEHGRWRIDVRGQGNHAGTTEIADRRDPMLPAAAAVAAARAAATRRTGSRATIGRLEPIPGGTNVIASRVAAWLDVRAGSEADTRAIVADVAAEVADAAAAEGCEATVVEESYSGEVRFDPALRDRLAAALGGVPVLPTGAGHDAGVLAGSVPTAMLFVRNPSGVSHAPEEGADDAAIEAGVAALVRALEELS
ncbi:allantoate amidohydrolase [Microbacterium marinilacus]|uniref:Allantoate amidohydrolase n=1 Tax=Microbacterium marinilacus TaxID=415209 RepID=A0ABP7BT33_9MICO|nr:allantoate amidohydrolase [Microbacterium marinilacus]MBY0689120.1 allantoate amidohydrolase [Microbacterium marinilacus]